MLLTEIFGPGPLAQIAILLSYLSIPFIILVLYSFLLISVEDILLSTAESPFRNRRTKRWRVNLPDNIPANDVVLLRQERAPPFLFYTS